MTWSREVAIASVAAATLIVGGCTGSGDAPTHKQVSVMEGSLVMPKGAGPLRTYARYYWIPTPGTVDTYRRCGPYDGPPINRSHVILRGALRTGEPPQIYLGKRPRTYCGGGCGVMELTFDLTAHRTLALQCNDEF